MASSTTPLQVKLTGSLACFTRPEMKVERVTYPVMTPSAARGALEAIFWKPEFAWRIEEIWVLRPIQYISLLRNEVNTKASERAASAWRLTGGGYDASADRAQRHTLALREVGYVVRAQIELRSGVSEDPAKYRDQFRRRVSSGRCFSMPYLGCREFVADFEDSDADDRPIDLTEDLGPMLRDIVYQPDGSGRGRPVFFEAHVDRGVLRVPDLPSPVPSREG